jgi:cyclopropane fatty-acyl-phospholipid synthase-like methyltransferase
MDEPASSPGLPEASAGVGAIQTARPDLPDLPRIRAYYDETWLDYRFLWLSPDNLAVHFGYWDEHTRTHAASLVNMNRLLARRIGIRSGLHVLDAGCGVGGSSLWLARTHGATVVGITPVASQIEHARIFARRQQMQGRVRFAQEDYTRTSFPDGSFDVIWAIESVCHAPDKRLFLREARRLLKPGGRLGIVEYIRFTRPYAAEDEALLASWLSGWAIPDIATRDEWQQWTGEAGFAEVAVEDIAAGVEPSLRRLYTVTQRCWWGASLLRRMGIRSETQHGNMRGARDIYRAVKRGLWFEALLTATAE